ncbi:very-long-chain 3-oxoacyl-CoA reductase-like [Aricia agestis]|uniref:very-long-chain 3-oxoacyl-CoA reductase-like n=1 Tax=Aricia agestis TaxID=91739 RepID=UPI001C201CAE|nr:very-long-chain 3-oxoacyl-CoA reductase-like [Aricia agestis]
MTISIGNSDIIVIVLGLYVAKRIYDVLYTFVIGPAINKVDFKSKGKWALVTGCTDGIGKQYARELAARGCDIVLVSRSLEKLNATAAEIEKEYRVNTKIVQVDFSEEEGIYEKIANEVSGLEIGTLVNNVGVSYPFPQYYLDIPDRDKLMTTMLRANIVSVTRVTAIVMPGMVERGKGVVINIGSVSSYTPSPLLTAYAASKAFVNKFTEGLDMEYSKKGIIFQCVSPGFVCTNMSGIRRDTLTAPTAERFVKSAISLVGTTSQTTGYFPHSVFFGIMNAINSISPRFCNWLVTRNMEISLNRALKKYKKQ